MKITLDLKTNDNKNLLRSIRRCLAISEWDDSKKTTEIKRLIAEREDIVDSAIERVKTPPGTKPITKERAFELTYVRPIERQEQYPTMVSWERFMKALDIYADAKVEQYKKSKR